LADHSLGGVDIHVTLLLYHFVVFARLASSGATAVDLYVIQRLILLLHVQVVEATLSAHSVAVRSRMLESITFDIILLVCHHAATATHHHMLIGALSIIMAIMGSTLVYTA
jgi:hypothetical protein